MSRRISFVDKSCLEGYTCPAYVWVMRVSQKLPCHSCVCVWVIRVWCLARSCRQRGSNVWAIRVSFVNAKRARHDTPITHTHTHTNDTRITHTWDMSHSYVRHDSSMCETWRIHTFDMYHSCVCFIRVCVLCVCAMIMCVCQDYVCSSCVRVSFVCGVCVSSVCVYHLCIICVCVTHVCELIMCVSLDHLCVVVSVCVCHVCVSFACIICVHQLCVCVICVCVSYVWDLITCVYGVATISRLLKIIGLFCKRAL